MTNETPHPAEIGDNEAAGLLMLFSNQNKRFPQGNSPPPTQQVTPDDTTQHSTEPAVHSAESAAPETKHPPNSHPMKKQTTPHNPYPLDAVTATSSPGVIPAALATGDPNNKAIVAAAAIAAAAATPLPLPKGKKRRASGNLGSPVQLKEKRPKVKGTKKEDTKKEDTKMEDNKKEDNSGEQSPEATEVKKERPGHSRRPSYAVEPDSGLISCVCGYDHDDGFTIQCDRCNRWQHAICMGINNIKEAPDNYLCYMCDHELTIDGDRARQLQEAKMGKKVRRAGKKDEKIIPVVLTKADKLFALKRYETFYLTISHYEYLNSSIMSLMKRLPKLADHIPDLLTFRDTTDFKRHTLNESAYSVNFPSDYWEGGFTGIDKVGVYAKKNISKTQLIMPIYGELQLKQDYLEERTNKYWLMGCGKPNTMFHPHLPIVIDERAIGNISRFVRKSCQPNCEIKTALVGDHRVIFVLAALHRISVGEELTLAWEWDQKHPIRQLAKRGTNLERSERIKVINAVNEICNIGRCACADRENCLIAKTRRLFAREKPADGSDFKISPASNQTYTPIEEQYIRREKIIEATAKDGDLAKASELVEESEEATTELVFTKQVKSSIIDDPRAPPKYQAVKRYLSRSSKPATTNDKSDDLLFTPFAVDPDAISEPPAKDKPESDKENKASPVLDKPAHDHHHVETPPVAAVVATATKKQTPEPAPSSKPAPKVVRKFSLADYKKKMKK